MKCIVHSLLFAVCLFLLSASPVSAANTYYISPNGTDTASGQTESEAWKTFSRALNGTLQHTPKMQAGDRLILLDGIYYDAIHPFYLEGQNGAPITISAKNDGQAI